jgi:hypothetical protein
MKWIVFWVALSINPGPCPQPEPFTDEYGIYHAGYYMQTSQACFETKKNNMSKEFDSLEAAQAFVDKAIKACGHDRQMLVSSCGDFEIKELKPIGGSK